MPDDYSNRQIGDFIVQEQLGRGALSVVYRAVQQSVNRSVALKIINLNLNPLARENYQPYFIQEAKVIATLEHIHIVPIYNYGAVDAESSYIALRLLRGGSVASLLESGAVPLYRAVDIFSQAARGLAHAHGRGIIHRDLKPSNILLDDLGNAYLTDFGLGKLAEVSLDLTESGNVIGTPLYASPEQLSGDPIDYRTDIYSMSAILYHMLTGCPPYELGEGGLADLIRAQATERPVPLRELNSAVPGEIEDIILQGLSRNPADRPDSIEEMAEAMNAALGRRSSPNSDPLIYLRSNVQPTVTSNRRRPVLVAAMVGIAVIVVALAALISRERGRPEASVIAGAWGNAADVIPTSEEVGVAREALGANGFIAFVACGTESEFQAAQAEAMLQRAEQYNISLRVYDSERDVYRQITELERARLDGARAIILCSLDSSALASSLQAAQAARVPLVFTVPIQPHYGGVALDGNDYALGQMAGSLAGNIIVEDFEGEGSVVILEHPAMEQSRERASGIEDGLFEVAPASYIVHRLSVENAAAARRQVAALLNDQTTSFNMIVSVEDALAYGAIEALEEAEVPTDSVAVVSINGEQRAQALVGKRHYLRATVGVEAEASAMMAVDAAVSLLGGGTLPEHVSYPSGTVYSALVLGNAH